jgi:predicted ATPase
LGHLGYLDQGLTRSHEAVALAQQVAHPFSLCLALSSAARFYHLRREVCCTQQRAETILILAKDQGFPFWMAVGASLCGWTLAQRGQVKEGIEQITQGLNAVRATGAEVARPYFLALLAEAYGTQGEPEAGLAALAEALTLADTTGERWYGPELYRLKGELLLQQNSDNQVEAENCFQQAITVAQSQQAKSFELRTATSLARLWQQQGKRDEAKQVLGDVYGWFTEGFDTADLQDAKALLDALSENQE